MTVSFALSQKMKWKRKKKKEQINIGNEHRRYVHIHGSNKDFKHAN